MTLDNVDLRTNEFQQRRRLRLQQVREQSKDIAKKIRQRARVEKIRHVLEVDSKKEKDYLECQEKLVKRLEQLYTQGVENLGSAHKDVFENTQGELIKEDLSKLRGIEAAAVLRRKKQEKLNEQKKLLDRKLKAREVANEFSREKSTAVAKALEKNPKNTEDLCLITNNKEITEEIINDQYCQKDKIESDKNDMATQWEVDELPNEWDPNIPTMAIPNCHSVKDPVNIEAEKSNRSKKIDLFALSDEMSLNINGCINENSTQQPTVNPSLSLISEYLQNRSLRLRQNEPSSTKKTNDLQSIKQTILRTRATKRDGSVFDNVCHVLDDQVIPVPSWEAETNSYRCNYVNNNNHISNSKHKSFAKITYNKGHLNTKLNSNYSKITHNQKRSSVIGFGSNRTEIRNCFKTVSGSQRRLSPTSENVNNLSKKGSVTVYNHNTKDTRAIPCDEERLVLRDQKSDDDAYAQALKETSVINTMEKGQCNKIQQDLRNKVAIQKQSVDREYKETLAFLNSLPKERVPMKTTYMNEAKEKLHRERHQIKMQEEFRKIEKENSKHNCKHSRRRSMISDKDRSKSKSPVTFEDGRENEQQYSWMPVPEGDGSLAIHTVPNITKHKSGNNTVKFSHINSYHEYRSRHKHTPPTKDSHEKQNKKLVETVVVEQNDSSECNDSTPSEHNSVDDLNIDEVECIKKTTDSRFLDADRIIIYKILDSKKKSKEKARVEMINKESKKKSVSVQGPEYIEKDNENGRNLHNSVNYDHLQEGVYKAVNGRGDNMTSMCFSETVGNQNNAVEGNGNDKSCSCGNTINNNNHTGTQKGENFKNVVETLNCLAHKCCCTSSNTNIDKDQPPQASTATSVSSFKTASNDKGSNALPDGGFIKFIDEAGKDNSKFYIGASGFLRDENFEVVIQLRKKDSEFPDSKHLNIEVPKPVGESSKTVGILEKKIQAQDEVIVTGEIESQPLSNTDNTNKESIPSHILVNKDNNVNSQNIGLNNENQNNSKSSVKNTKTESDILSELPDMCEKIVHTSFQDTYAIPDDIQKSDRISRPATSTYTQTTFSSPIPRPAFMHMSSSTSTAYMSPPELILPRFLKQDYIVTNEEMYDSERVHQQHVKNVINERDFDHDESCRCKHCHSDNNRDSVQKHFCKKSCRRKVLRSVSTKTPPNTARSLDVDGKTSKRKTCKNTKCHKCVSRSDTKLCNKSYNKYIANAKSTGDIPCENFKTTTKHSNVKSHSSNRSQLDSVTKEYVNKLLSIKKEGLKAIEVINQDCSSVTTPGSSIINVTSNIDGHKPVCGKISLEQIKALLKRKISLDYNIMNNINKKSEETPPESSSIPVTKKYLQLPKKRSVHKVKSLNISKRMKKPKKLNSCQVPAKNYEDNKTKSSIASTKDESSFEFNVIETTKRSKSSPTPRRNDKDFMNISSKSDPTRKVSKVRDFTKNDIRYNKQDTLVKNNDRVKCKYRKDSGSLHINRATKTITSSDSDKSLLMSDVGLSQVPITITTQTNGIIINNEINYMKIAEDKLQNMEKIADLTDKCTKRLSNLAKVLEEVRKNKSLVYNQVSSSESTPDPERKTDLKLCSELSSLPSNKNIFSKGIDIATTDNLTTPPKDVHRKDTYDNIASSNFVPLLINIPKPNLCKSPVDGFSISDEKSYIESSNNEHTNGRYRGKPPVALSRIHLKQGLDTLITPHELSTVIEVDSPMSIKTKNQSSHHGSRYDFADKINIDTHSRSYSNQNCDAGDVISNTNHHFQRKHYLTKITSNTSTSDSSCDSKIQMLDMKQFNDIMLKPFISIQEYAKQCNVGIEEGSNVSEMLKENAIIDDLTSLNSDSSLPDVIGELIKRNVISEPFKYDNGSNNNSTAMSSESTLSVLALSKVYKKKMVSEALLKHRENLAETSDTMSISSNPDLENAFQKLGMGWASSTLKKTKERLALTSSSSTSSSSLTRFKIRSFNQNMPEISIDSVSSSPNLDDKVRQKIIHDKNFNDAVQQTSLSNSMTVKEFLTKELAKKITFTNKSHSKEAEVEFISLYETKMPDEIKNTRFDREDSHSRESVTSANNNRARTSTPVQIFKSATYHSSSSSNMSNGLFSNADDLSSVKVTSTSIRNHSTSDKEDLTIPNYSLKIKKKLSDHSKSD